MNNTSEPLIPHEITYVKWWSPKSHKKSHVPTRYCFDTYDHVWHRLDITYIGYAISNYTNKLY